MEMIVFFFVFTAFAYWLRNSVHFFLVDHQLILHNYRGVPVAIGYGLYLWLLAFLFGLLQSVAASIGYGWERSEHNSFILLCLSVVFFLGWLDDTIGSTEPKGMAGHLKIWHLEKRWTTGLVKAVGIAIIAWWVVWELQHPWWIKLLQWLLLTLSSNMINLLDVRPGRAMKGFWLLSTVVFLSSYFFQHGLYMETWRILFPFLIGTVMLFPFDLHEKGMLGDAGANLLGFAAGYAAIVSTPYWVQYLLLIIFVVLHGYAEKHSISRGIEKITWLRKIDRWGRG